MNEKKATKSTFAAKSNDDAMLLAPSNVSSMAHVDNSNQNQSEILRFSKDFDF